MAVLVLQKPHLAQLNWQAWSNVFSTHEIQNHSVWRIQVADDFALTTEQNQWLPQHQVYATVLPDISFSDLGLIISDMDSTLITIECIDEIAAGNGLKDQVAAITERSMAGELDFAESLRERVALLKGLPESELA